MDPTVSSLTEKAANDRHRTPVGLAAFTHMIQKAFDPMAKTDILNRRLRTVFAQMNAELISDVHWRKKHIASSMKFNLVIYASIVINGILIGIEVDHGRGDKMEDRFTFFFFDAIFSIVFFVEMLFKLHQLSWDYFADPWNVFDYSLVVLNCVDLAATMSDEGGMAGIRILRLLRLLRIVRVIRGFRVFRELWMIIVGLLDSVRTILWVSLAMFILLYCIGTVLCSTLGEDPKARETWINVKTYVGTVPRAIWTSIQLITLDAWASEIARPMSFVAPITTYMCIGALFVCTFGLLNVIVAVMIERTLANAKDQHASVSGQLEKTELAVLKSMGEEYVLADNDGNGELTLTEFQELVKTPSFSLKLRLLNIPVEEAESIFEMMDADKSGAVSPEEFITGLQKVKGNAKGADLVQLICFSQKQGLRATRYVERAERLIDKVDVIQERLDILGQALSIELSGRMEAKWREDSVWRRAGEREQLLLNLDSDQALTFPALGRDG